MTESSPGFSSILSFAIPTPKRRGAALKASLSGHPGQVSKSSPINLSRAEPELGSVPMLKLYSADQAALGRCMELSI